jgi:hypothetical protein
MYVDSDYANDELTWRSHSSFFIYLNGPSCMFPNKQATTETSIFGAKFVAMKHGMKLCKAYVTSYGWWELVSPVHHDTFMGVICPCYIIPNIPNWLWNRSQTQSATMRFVSQWQWVNVLATGHVPTNDNPSDLATKLIPGGMKWDHLVGLVLYDICDDHSWWTSCIRVWRLLRVSLSPLWQNIRIWMM